MLQSSERYAHYSLLRFGWRILVFYKAENFNDIVVDSEYDCITFKYKIPYILIIKPDRFSVLIRI